MKPILLAAVFACLMGCAQNPRLKPDATSVAQAVQALTQAMVSADEPSLSRLTAANLSYGHSSGNIEDKAAFIQALVSGTSDFVSIDLLDQTIQVTGETAIVRHILSAKTNDRGTPGEVRIGVLLVWQWQEGSWKLLARQAFRLPQPA